MGLEFGVFEGAEGTKLSDFLVVWGVEEVGGGMNEIGLFNDTGELDLTNGGESDNKSEAILFFLRRFGRRKGFFRRWLDDWQD
mmetsp:Transcript_14771/g.20966  ORF Transcript_14771/g.20966 Transcript_14771/m.20966 type:complete len:83 (-) Transcript_14771:487-735(-)